LGVLLIGGLTATTASAASCDIAESTGNWCSVHTGQVACTSIAGIQAADADMNDSQLRSLQCVRFTHEVDVKPLGSIEGGRYSKVRLNLEDRVVTFWVKDTY
jgi:hypothetical protein